MNDYYTEEFIELLPLPKPVKEFINDVAKKFCEEDHPESEEEEEEDSEDYYYPFSNYWSSCSCDGCASAPYSSDVEEEEEKTDSDNDETQDESDMEDRNANVDQAQKNDAGQDEGTSQVIARVKSLRVKSLQESCAKTILKLTLNHYQWPGPSGAVINGFSFSRCPCRNCSETFISTLPLPDDIKELITVVSNKGIYIA